MMRNSPDNRGNETPAARRDGGKIMSTSRNNGLALALAGIGIFAATSALAPRAEAACCVAYDYGDAGSTRTQAESNREQVKQHFTTELTRVENSIVEALRSFSGQQTVNSRAAVNATSNMADLQDQRQVQLRVQDVRMEAFRSAASGASVCNVITGNVAGGTMFGAIPQWRDQITQVTMDYMMGASDRTASKNGAAAGIAQRGSSVCAANATQDMVDAGLCTAVTQFDSGSAAGGPPRMSDAYNANIMLGSSVLSSRDRDSARLYMANAFVPNPLGGVPRGVASTEAGQRLMADRAAAASRQSHALTVAADFFADRVPMPESQQNAPVVSQPAAAGAAAVTTGLRSWAEGTARQTLTYNTEGNNFPDGVSRAAWLELRAKAWFMNANWAIRVDTQNANQTAKDLAMMGAFQSYMGWEQYRQMERMNMSLALIVSMLEEQGRPRQ